MNANELADSIATCEPNLGRIATDCADMIRQQQAEIEVLKAKTLTDEEIAQEWGNFCPNVLEFARAILRKAQEK
jgi:hypothetical protein